MDASKNEFVLIFVVLGFLDQYSWVGSFFGVLETVILGVLVVLYLKESI